MRHIEREKVKEKQNSVPEREREKQDSASEREGDFFLFLLSLTVWPRATLMRHLVRIKFTMSCLALLDSKFPRHFS